MKKLIYNENTKEIDIVEKEDFPPKEEKKKKGLKLWLENNKIYFEVFSYLFVGAMGIIISFVGLKFNERTTEIYQRQLEILDNDREPYFSISCEKIYEQRKENGYFIINKYTIKNDGGLIKDAYLSNIDSYIMIYDKNSGIVYKYYFDGKFSTPNKEYVYNLNTKTFCFYANETDQISNFTEALVEDLAFLFDEYNVVISINNQIRINYINYKNEKQGRIYEFSKDGIFAKSEDDIKKEIVLGRNRFSESYESMRIAMEIFECINEKYGYNTK